jgi:hypothetical protein
LDEIEQDIHNQLAEIDNTTEAISLDNGKRVYLNINGDYIYANGEAIEDEDREEVRRRAQELNQRGMRVRTTQEQARYNELTQALTEAHTIRQEMQRDRGEFEQIQRDANSGKIDANEANERVRSRQEEMRDRLEEVKRHTMPASHTSIFTQIDAEEETEPKTGLSNEFHSANLDSIDDDNNPIIDNTISEEIEHDGLSSTTEESPDNQSFFGKINLG